MYVRSWAFLFAISCAAAVTGYAQSSKHPIKDSDRDIKLGEDEAGCKDSSLLARIPGCSIIQCDTKPEAENIELQVGATQDGDPQKEAMDGAEEIIYYLCPSKLPQLGPAKTPLVGIRKSLEATLLAAGYKIVFSGHDGDDMPIVTALKDTQWIQISTYMYNDYSAYIQTTLKVPAEDQASSDAFAEEMNKNGRIVLSGIAFKEDELLPDSEKTLTAVQAFLVRQPDMRVRVEAYTDNKAGKNAAYLTQKQASAVASWLLNHGIDKVRITIEGKGEDRPLGDNNTPEGQAKNRRIELVKF